MTYPSLLPPDSRLPGCWNYPAIVFESTTIRFPTLPPNIFPIQSPNPSPKYPLTVAPFPPTNPTNACLLWLIFNSKVEGLKHSSSKSISGALSASSFINDPEKKRTNVNSWWVLMIQNYVASWGGGQRAGKIHHDLDQLSNWADTWPIKCVHGRHQRSLQWGPRKEGRHGHAASEPNLIASPREGTSTPDTRRNRVERSLGPPVPGRDASPTPTPAPAPILSNVGASVSFLKDFFPIIGQMCHLDCRFYWARKVLRGHRCWGSQQWIMNLWGTLEPLQEMLKPTFTLCLTVGWINQWGLILAPWIYP